MYFLHKKKDEKILVVTKLLILIQGNRLVKKIISDMKLWKTLRLRIRIG